MMTLARSLSAASLSTASARAASTLSSSMSNTLPWRTLATPEMPNDLSAPSIALPWGSSTPGLRVTVTRAFIAAPLTSPWRGEVGRRSRPGGGETKREMDRRERTAPRRADARRRPSPSGGGLSLHQHRAGALGALVLAHDAEAPGDFGIGLHEAAEVAAEAVHVELLVGLDVPQPARIRGNLVGDDDAHHVVFPQPAAFHLEVDEADADPKEDPREEVVHPDGERHDVVDLLRRRPAEGGDVLLRDHRVAETEIGR